MAWRSSGATNEEMVDNLKKFGVISSDFICEGFRNVDRKFFVPNEQKESAYADQPLKEGHIHISAPHIYGSALEALELQPNSNLSFLNIGSGTGYLSCIVGEILGPKSLNYGIEIREDVITHSKTSVLNWKKKYPENLKIVHGNALCVSSKGESLVGFDRIYIGASVDKANLPNITKLLSPGGVLIGPVDDELVKIVRIGIEDDFTQHVLSGVRFAPLVTTPDIDTVLPARLWSPNLHHFFPSSFQKASMQLFLCSNSDYNQPLPPPSEKRVNLAATLPRVIWIEILSFTHRKWFEKETTTEFLKKRLVEEQAVAAKAKQARAEAEARCQIAERERDHYRLLARRWQSRLQLFLNQLIEVTPPQEETLGEEDSEAGLYFSAQESSMDEDNEEEEDQLIDFMEQQETEEGYDLRAASANIEEDVESVHMEESFEDGFTKNQIRDQIRTVSMGSND